MINWYFDAWWKIIARPIYFYATLKPENWREKPLSFFLVSSWLLAAITSMVVFALQFVPIGAKLIEGITGYKFLFILPVVIVLGAMFYLITLAIVGGLFAVGFGAAFYIVGSILNFSAHMIGVKGKLDDFLQRSFYTSAALLIFIFPMALALTIKYGLLDLATFRVGYNFIYFLVSIYLYGLWAIAFRNITSTVKWKAFALAVVPFILLLILGLAFDKIALTKVETWIAPLK